MWRSVEHKNVEALQDQLKHDDDGIKIIIIQVSILKMKLLSMLHHVHSMCSETVMLGMSEINSSTPIITVEMQEKLN